jgi:hypothetical protein
MDTGQVTNFGAKFAESDDSDAVSVDQPINYSSQYKEDVALTYVSFDGSTLKLLRSHDMDTDQVTNFADPDQASADQLINYSSRYKKDVAQGARDTADVLSLQLAWFSEQLRHAFGALVGY